MPDMDKRRYVQNRRAEAAQETRGRILDATRESLRNGPVGAVRIEEVARAAGVARSTIYVAFGSRAGLFDALAEDLLGRAGFGRIAASFRLPDARDALRSSLRDAAEIYSHDPAVTRSILALAAIDPDAGAAVSRFEHGRWPGMRMLAGRLEQQGALRPGVSRDEAAQVLWILTGFATFDQLFGERGLSTGVVADRLGALAERTLLREAAVNAR
jgi:AcrR family transcriptional regulator